MKTTLYILKSPFKDPALSDSDYICWSCMLLEGVLTQFGKPLENLTVNRVDFARPREQIISLIGEGNQSVPVLVLAKDDLRGEETDTFNGVRFIEGHQNILAALNKLYGLPLVHP